MPGGHEELVSMSSQAHASEGASACIISAVTSSAMHGRQGALMLPSTLGMGKDKLPTCHSGLQQLCELPSVCEVWDGSYIYQDHPGKTSAIDHGCAICTIHLADHTLAAHILHDDIIILSKPSVSRHTLKSQQHASRLCSIYTVTPISM